MDDEWDEVIRSNPYHVTAEDYIEAILAMKKSVFSNVFQFVETVLVIGMLTVCTVDWYRNGFDYIRLGLMVICVLLMVGVWVLPRLRVESMAKDLVRAECFVASVEPDWVALRQGSGEWLISLDDTSCFRETKHLFLLEEENHHSAVLRKDAFDDPDAVRAMLAASTTVVKV